MTQRKSERILNLTICLLSARRFVTREQLRSTNAGYKELNDGAFERTFERDKDELRQLGVPIEIGYNDPLFEDEIGYRIPRKDFELPPVEFTAQEATVIGVAARVWESEQLADDAAGALAKLRAAGLEPDTDRLAALAPTIAAREPSFEVFRAATSTRTRVGFDYRDQPRRLEPWRLASRHGNWYVLGRDVDKDEPRMFKLTRVTSMPRLLGKPKAYEVPSDVDLSALMRELEPKQPSSLALVAVRGDQAPALRRRGRLTDAPGPLPGFAVYEVPFARASDLAMEARGHAADVLVLEPAELRDEVLAGLRRIAGEES